MRRHGVMFLTLQNAGATATLARDKISRDHEVTSDRAEMCVPREMPST